jgi:oxygen-independent coproporphyrinogen-3 oxidase
MRNSSDGTGSTTPEPEVGNYFVSAYPPFSCWSPDGVDAFRRRLEKSPASGDGTEFGLYVHLPFCVKRCDYCYYLSYDDRPEEIDRYLDALATELKLYADAPAISGRPLSFVYFGGGTPSLLSVKQTRRLLRDLGSSFPCSAVREASFECAPRSVTEEKLRVLRDAGITRISLGVQQLDDAVLERSGRVHRVRDIERAYELIRRVGFDIVNLDLMVGLVGESEKSFLDSLDRIIELSPESVTIYQLEIPLNTPLYRAICDVKVPAAPASWEVKRARLDQGFRRLEQAGYVVRSGYTAVRDPERHPFVYQDEQYRGADLLGIGVSAFSCLGGVHQQNLASLDHYVDSLLRGELPLWRAYELSDDERLVRELVLQLKLGRLEREYFRVRFGVEVTKRFEPQLSRLAKRGWIEIGDRAIVVTRQGLLRVDRILPELYLPEHRVARYS